jgi:DnaJ-class molecular chaperone
VSDLAPTEIKALARILDELDYYQLIHVSPSATPSLVKAAYYATSRAFHPDANRHLEGELQSAVAKVAKRITEAYSVLRDPRRRQAYDRRLEAGAGVRMQLAEAQAEAGRQSTEERQGRTREGRQYFALAVADLKRKDFLAAERHLRTALTFEPENPVFKEQLASVRKLPRPQ